jgi:hypothetical protein
METAAFVAATVSKAWEPLSLAISQHNEHSYPFLATMVLCEMAKLAATIVALLTFTRERWMPLLLARSTVSAFAFRPSALHSAIRVLPILCGGWAQ